MVNYSKSVIYKIQHNETESLCYIGSTCNFKNRKHNHKNYCYNENGKAYNYKLYQMIRNNGGWDAFRMVVIEEFPCESKTQLCIREEQVRIEYKADMNTLKAHRTAEEKIEQIKQWHIENRTEIKEYNKQYHHDHRDDLNQKKKQKVTCECGCIVNRSNLSTHKKTNKHLNSRDKTPS